MNYVMGYSYFKALQTMHFNLFWTFQIVLNKEVNEDIRTSRENRLQS